MDIRDDKSNVIKMYTEDGKSTREIGEYYGVTDSWASHVLNEWDYYKEDRAMWLQINNETYKKIPIVTGRSFSKEEIQKLYCGFKNQISESSLAKELGFNRSRVHRMYQVFENIK